MWFLVALGLVAAVVLAGLPFLVFPAHDEPAKADVALVLGPPTDTRMELAQSMVDEGLTEHVLVSLDPEESEMYPLAGEICASGDDTYVCAKPDPFTTRGEAIFLQEEATKNGWTNAAVITFTPHISRSRMIMKNCFDGEVSMLDSGESVSLPFWAYQYAYQSAATVKALIQGRCDG